LTLAENGRQIMNGLEVMVNWAWALESCVRPP